MPAATLSAARISICDRSSASISSSSFARRNKFPNRRTKDMAHPPVLPYGNVGLPLQPGANQPRRTETILLATTAPDESAARAAPESTRQSRQARPWSRQLRRAPPDRAESLDTQSPPATCSRSRQALSPQSTRGIKE